MLWLCATMGVLMVDVMFQLEYGVCVNGELLSALDVMNTRWDYRGHRLVLVMRMVDRSSRSIKVVDGARSMVMMAVVEMVISCHDFLSVGYYFVFGIFSFLWILVVGYGHYIIFNFFRTNRC